MPRNSAGVYALPPSNPVVPFTTITTSWANPTMADIASELTNSLDRTGRGGMLAPFRIFDGNASEPGLSFTNEPTLGIFRSGSGQMHFTANSTSLFKIDYSLRAAVSPSKFVVYVEQQIRTVNQKWWQIKDEIGVLTITPSNTVDAEDWDYNKSFKYSSEGDFYSSGGYLTATGTLTVNQVYIPTNVNLTNIGCNIACLLTSIGSTGAISANLGTSHKFEVRAQNTPNNAAYLVFHRPGLHAIGFGLDTDNELKVGGWSLSPNAYKVLHENNSFAITTIGAAPAVPALVAGAKLISANAFTAGYTHLGSYSGSINPQNFQTVGVSSGSVITAISRVAGQVFRIFVTGGGSVVLPSYVKLASGTIWGTTYSMISLWTDGTTIWATVTPFST